MTVEDDRQVSPALRAPEIRDVADPDLIGCSGGDAQNSVWNGGEEVVCAWGAAIEARRPGQKPCAAHEARDSLAAHVEACTTQGSVNARAAVGPRAGGEDLPDASEQGVVIPCVMAGPAAAEGVEARARDAVATAEVGYAEPVLLREDEGERLGLRAEQNRMAFFSSSCSSRSSA